ncbi:MAG TPA: hypothetical protein VMZ50_11805, partial [Phycisphaerae bacterium]|nr:hypothetical protein [Phycisphaerae bacterium]
MKPFLAAFGVSGAALDRTAGLLVVVVILGLALAANLAARHFVRTVVHRLVVRSRTRWDEELLEQGVFHRAAHLVPALLIYGLAPLAFPEHPGWAGFLRSGAEIYLVIAGMLLLDALAEAGLAIYGTYSISRQVPVKGFVQVFKILVYFIGIIILVSMLLGRSPVYFVSGMGALTA